MPVSAPEFAAGLPVEVAQIPRALKKLWEESDGAMTRASLINLAVYSAKPDALDRNTALMSEITQEHACRAIVIGARPSAEQSRVSAWITAHCHVTKAGRKQVCSEQLTFLLEGDSTALLPNILYSHLDSDLPLHLWWQDEFPSEIEPQLWAWVDRLIFDSRAWPDFHAQMSLVRQAQEEAKQRVTLCDLNWARLLQWRVAVAQFFDHPLSRHHLARISRLEIDHAPGCRSTALLLAGWFARQLDWRVNESSPSLVLRKESGDRVQITLAEKKGEPVSRCLLAGEAMEFRVQHRASTDLLEVSCGSPGKACDHQLMPAGATDDVGLMRAELMRGGPHHVYLRAVERISPLL